MSVSSVEIVKRSYDAFARGDLDAVLGDMDPEIEWHQAQGLPHGGLYHGLDEVRANIFDPLDDEWWNDFTAVPDEFLDAGDQVVVIGRYRAVGKHTRQTTGRPLRPYLDHAGRQGDPLPSVPRYGGLGRGSADLIIDTACRSEETRCSARHPPSARPGWAKEDY